MSEIMRPIPFQQLVQWALEEYKNHGSVFGIRKEKFYRPPAQGGIELLGSRISTPIGPAAGPHAQLAQNILAAYLSGARFMELKTVQTMDGEELRKCVARPCIAAIDEGYNVEWSTELTVAEAREEYVKAWFLCHIFAKEFSIAESADFIFNMSVGYSLEGIKSDKIDSYIEGMKNAAGTGIWESCYDYIAANTGLFSRFSKSDLDAVSPRVSSSITLSTLHGCPREEIEKIASYLITGKGLHTYVKCNPTLLGYDTARSLLDEMGYHYVSFDDHHFKNDLQFGDAVEMLGRLKKTAGERSLGFGVKLTNTFPVRIERNELPGSEMYMSGRSLYPLSINVAKKLTGAFGGSLAISYSGGADFFNLKDILKTGIRPVTLATAVLKPGGYERFFQLAAIAQEALSENQPPKTGGAVIDEKKLDALVEKLPGQARYRREYRQTGARKPVSPFPPRTSLPLFDCYRAPCSDNVLAGDPGFPEESGCPIHQRIPAYLEAVASGDYGKAFAVIARDNTAPSVTGTLCDHRCQNLCTRVDYEDPLMIRQAKLIASEKAQDAYIESLSVAKSKTGKSAAVIGAGPAGIAAAVFLRRNGVPVTVYEKRDKPFGIVRYVIPSFRIPQEAIDRDFRVAEKLGVEFKFNSPQDYSVDELKKTHEFVVIATGAWKEGETVLKQGQAIDALRFLEDSKKTGCGLDLGKRVAIIGGGDVAMDCARAAKRNRGVEHAAVVYRRTREFMPSMFEEQELALRDGVEFMELLAPETFSGGVLRCEVMRLGEFDSSGRRRVEKTGEKRDLPFDTVIGAVGAGVDTGGFSRCGIALNARGFPGVNGARESSVPGVYITGDCKSGAATVVRAIADGKAAAADILRKLGLEADFSADPIAPSRADGGQRPGFADLYCKKGSVAEAGPDSADAARCLSCDILCEICADVCPNRANVMIDASAAKAAGNGFAQPHQIVHIDRSCNECGNCSSFCPHTGRPYKDKLTVFSCEDDFSGSENPGFLRTGADSYKLRLEDKSVVNYRRGEKHIPGAWAAMIETIEEKYCYLQ